MKKVTEAVEAGDLSTLGKYYKMVFPPQSSYDTIIINKIMYGLRRITKNDNPPTQS